MVFYIRFLKVPKISPSSGPIGFTITTTITLTSDLGDEFLAHDVDLFAHLGCTGVPHPPPHRQTWHAGMRALPLSIRVNQKVAARPVRLCISSSSSSSSSSFSPSCSAADDLSVTRMPELVSARSGPFGASASSEAPRRIERRFRVEGGDCPELSIWEETGESIARHVWDAGLGLVAHLRDLLLRHPGQPALSPLGHLLCTPRSTPLRVIELGSGCGIAGLALAQMRPHSQVLLTDLPEAMDILALNASATCLPRGSQVETQSLDWDAELPESVHGRRFELVLVSDCTYNADSLPALVRTLRAVTRGQRAVLVLVAMKVRHESEKVFFELMAGAGFAEVEHSRVGLPDWTRGGQGRSLDVVEIYAFSGTGGKR